MNEIVKFYSDGVTFDSDDEMNMLSDYFDEFAQALRIDEYLAKINAFDKEEQLKQIHIEGELDHNEQVAKEVEDEVK